MKDRTKSSVSQAFAAPAVWITPLVLVAALVFVMTLVYLGSVVDPSGHLHGLPVAVVNEDTGATVGARRVDFGEQVALGLERSPALADRLSLRAGSLTGIKDRMGLGKEY